MRLLNKGDIVWLPAWKELSVPAILKVEVLEDQALGQELVKTTIGCMSYFDFMLTQEQAHESVKRRARVAYDDALRTFEEARERWNAEIVICDTTQRSVDR